MSDVHVSHIVNIMYTIANLGVSSKVENSNLFFNCFPNESSFIFLR